MKDSIELIIESKPKRHKDSKGNVELKFQQQRYLIALDGQKKVSVNSEGWLSYELANLLEKEEEKELERLIKKLIGSLPIIK